MIKNENYILIQGFMINELNLKGNELLIYAIIYGFSQDGSQKFSGTLQYLADWTNSTKQGVLKNLQSLLEKGYIGKEERIINNVKFVEYYSTKFNGGIKQSLINNNINNIKKENNIKEKTKFIRPTVEEIEEYCQERNNGINPESFFDYYESVGWKVGKKPMKDWKSAIRTWERNSNTNNSTKIESKEIEFGMYQL